MHQLLPDIGVAVLAATLLGLVAHWSRQPITLGYLLAGAAIGPKVGLALVHDQASIGHLRNRPDPAAVHYRPGDEPQGPPGVGEATAAGGVRTVALCALLGAGLFMAMGYGLR